MHQMIVAFIRDELCLLHTKPMCEGAKWTRAAEMRVLDGAMFSDTAP